LPNVPIGQGVQKDAPEVEEYVPGGQRLHVVDPRDDHEPAKQSEHVVLIVADNA